MLPIAPRPLDMFSAEILKAIARGSGGGTAPPPKAPQGAMPARHATTGVFRSAQDHGDRTDFLAVRLGAVAEQLVPVFRRSLLVFVLRESCGPGVLGQHDRLGGDRHIAPVRVCPA